MNEDELMTVGELVQHNMEVFRTLATLLQERAEEQEDTYTKSPALQAEEIITGKGYKHSVAVFRFIKMMADKEYEDAFVAMTEEEQEEDEKYWEHLFSLIYGPPEALKKSMLDVKNLLHECEKGIVNWGFKLPEWDRPLWLRVMEEAERKDE